MLPMRTVRRDSIHGPYARRMLLLTCVLALLPACSWLFVEAPPVAHERLPSFECTESSAAPIGDTAAAVAYGLVGVLGLAVGIPGAHGETNGFGADNVAMFTIGAADATVFGLSAGYGYGATSACRHAKAKWAQRAAAPRFRR
jgi:hypothetical protein